MSLIIEQGSDYGLIRMLVLQMEAEKPLRTYSQSEDEKWKLRRSVVHFNVVFFETSNSSG